MDKLSALTKEIEKAKLFVSTDDYSVSIGELSNWYSNKEIIINPDFQRLFRWSPKQKSALIESILLGIPIPPIFVYENKNGVYELIDGLQRVSTLLEFMGVLFDADGKPVPSSTLTATDYIPSLEGAHWHTDPNIKSEYDIGSALRLHVKRAKLGIQILRKESVESSKYDLFQRLNGNGSILTPQEFRTCVLIMIDSKKFSLIKDLAGESNFMDLLSLSDDAVERQGDLDYACRAVAHLRMDLPADMDVEEYVTAACRDAFKEPKAVSKLVDKCRRAAALLVDLFEKKPLRRYTAAGFTGRQGRVGFEGVFVGVANNIDKIELVKDKSSYLESKLQSFWASEEVNSFLSAGTRGTTRISKSLPFGKTHFDPASK
jgi:Protein of unknown function DUF262